jgi:hypothetical protein
VRALDVRVAGGLHALVLTDRGMDLGPAWYLGQPLAWVSPTGIVHPSYAAGNGWLGSFHGGLLVTAGLQNVGPDCDDDGEHHGFHGRLSNTPARSVSWRIDMDGDLPVVEVRGTVRETSVYGANLELTRVVRFPVGSARVEIHDVVENSGFAPAALMILYHVNLGWPVVDEGSRFVAPPRRTVPFDDAAAAALGEHEAFRPPRVDVVDEVFEHCLDPVPDVARVGVVNAGFEPTAGIGAVVEYRPSQLPHLWHWRMLAAGMYVTGIEPANCGVAGRAVERRERGLDLLAAGESRSFQLAIEALTGPAATRLVAAYSEGDAL